MDNIHSGTTKHSQLYEIVMDSKTNSFTLRLFTIDPINPQNLIAHTAFQRRLNSSEKMFNEVEYVKIALKSGEYQRLRGYFNTYQRYVVEVPVDHEILYHLPAGVMVGRPFFKPFEAKHVGVSLGNGDIIHYNGGGKKTKENAKANFTNFKEFCEGQKFLHIMIPILQRRTESEIIADANYMEKTEYGKNKYSIFTNSCQHLATLLIFGVSFGLDHWRSAGIVGLLSLNLVLFAVTTKYIFNYCRNLVKRDIIDLVAAGILWLTSVLVFAIYLSTHL